MEARHVANYYKRRIEVRHIEEGFVIVFPHKENAGTLIKAVEPV